MIRRLRSWARTGARWLYVVVIFALVVVMLVPNLLVWTLSFSGEEFIRFPPRTWGLRQYETFFGSDRWLGPLRLSLELGLVVALVSVLMGGAAVIAFARSKLPGSNLIQMLSLGPLLVPSISYAIAAYGLFVRLRLIDTFIAIVIAHTVIAVPMVVLIVGAAINRVPQELELVAMSLGANRWRAYWDVTIPLLAPAFLASFIFAFVTSFDEVTVSSFLSGMSYLTLPKAIFDSIRYGVDAVITAIATILSLATALLLGVAAALRSRVT